VFVFECARGFFYALSENVNPFSRFRPATSHTCSRARAPALTCRWLKSFCGEDGKEADEQGEKIMIEKDGKKDEKDYPTIYFEKNWFVDWHSFNRVTVEVNDEVLTEKCKTYEAVAAHMTATVKSNNLENMLVSFPHPSFAPCCTKQAWFLDNLSEHTNMYVRRVYMCSCMSVRATLRVHGICEGQTGVPEDSNSGASPDRVGVFPCRSSN
jgi:hypothetical protein